MLVSSVTASVDGTYSVLTTTGQNYRIIFSSAGYISSLVTNVTITTSAPTTVNAMLQIGDTHLAGYWKFDENSGSIAFDYSGRCNQGVLVDTPTWSTGKTNTGLQFDGVSDHVLVNHSPGLDFYDKLTVCAWVYRNSVSASNYGIVSKSESLPGQAGWKFMLKSNQVAYGLTGGGPDVYGNANVPAQAWSFITVTRDGSTIKFYLNGTLTGTISDYTGGVKGLYPLKIGSTYSSVSGVSVESFAGKIDEVRIYDTALSSVSINALYVGTVPDGTVSGKITTSNGTTPITGAVIELSQNSVVITRAYATLTGDYSITVTTGTYTMTISSIGYLTTQQQNVVVQSEQTTTVNTSLTSVFGVVTGNITKPDSITDFSDVLIELLKNDVAVSWAMTDTGGNYSIIAASGVYDVRVTSAGFGMITYTNVMINPEQTVSVNLTLLYNQLEPPLTGTLSSSIVRSANFAPVPGSMIEIISGNTVIKTVRAGKGGMYSVLLVTGTYTVRVSSAWYVTQSSAGIVISTFSVTTYDCYLIWTKGILSGKITNQADSVPIPNATITVLTNAGTGQAGQTYSDSTGRYSVMLDTGTYTVITSRYGYTTSTRTAVTVVMDETTELNIGLTRIVITAVADTVLAYPDLTLEIPAGTLWSDATIIVTELADLAAYPVPKNNFIIPKQMARQVVFDNNQMTLSKNIKLVFRYTDNQVSSLSTKSADEQHLRMFWWDPVSHMWQYLQSSVVDPGANTVTAYHNKPGIYCVMEYNNDAFGTDIVRDVSNYPNPFYAGSSGGTTKIRYYLRTNSDVKIKIYDLLGDIVWTTDVAGMTGPNETVWDGKNNDGLIVDRGIYTGVLTAGPDKKMFKLGVK
jgi:hypothetical protein